MSITYERSITKRSFSQYIVGARYNDGMKSKRMLGVHDRYSSLESDNWGKVHKGFDHEVAFASL